MDRSGDLQKRIQQKIREQIQKLKDAQSDRAEVIEAALKDFESSKFFKKRIRTIQDYIALAQMQRRMLGFADNRSEVDHKVGGGYTVVFERAEKEKPPAGKPKAGKK